MQCHPCHAQQLNKQGKVLASSYLLHGQTLETTSATTTARKYLGITISSDLSWAIHVQNAVLSMSKPDRGVPVKEFQEIYSKSQVSD